MTYPILWRGQPSWSSSAVGEREWEGSSLMRVCKARFLNSLCHWKRQASILVLFLLVRKQRLQKLRNLSEACYFPTEGTLLYSEVAPASSLPLPCLLSQFGHTESAAGLDFLTAPEHLAFVCPQTPCSSFLLLLEDCPASQGITGPREGWYHWPNGKKQPTLLPMYHTALFLSVGNFPKSNGSARLWLSSPSL